MELRLLQRVSQRKNEDATPECHRVGKTNFDPDPEAVVSVDADPPESHFRAKVDDEQAIPAEAEAYQIQGRSQKEKNRAPQKTHATLRTQNRQKTRFTLLGLPKTPLPHATKQVTLSPVKNPPGERDEPRNGHQIPQIHQGKTDGIHKIHQRQVPQHQPGNFEEVQVSIRHSSVLTLYNMEFLSRYNK